MRPPHALALLLASLLAGAPLAAQEAPLTAGSEGVPVPRKVKDQKPIYPADAIARGVRGIVVLDLVIDPLGHVAEVTVVRSVPGLDEAAVAAARRWQYEPVKVQDRPRSVRLTVPITFALELPQLQRAPGIPELRQGALPFLPADSDKGATAEAEVTLEPDGRVGSVQLPDDPRTPGYSKPLAGALAAALRTWRFAMPPADLEISFRVVARVVARTGSAAQRIALEATGLRQSDLMGAPLRTSAAPSDTPAASPRTDTPATPPTTASGTPAAPGSVPDAPSRSPEPPSPGAAGPGTAPITPPPTPAEVPGAQSRSAPPPVEVITAPAPLPPPENGISTISGVSLEPGVPELSKGRRPVPPPLARMAAASGTVQVDFSVGAAGTTTIQTVSGPELLKKAAEQTVASWVFRRTRADRAYLTALFDYSDDKATASVRPQPAPGTVPATLAPADRVSP